MLRATVRRAQHRPVRQWPARRRGRAVRRGAGVETWPARRTVLRSEGSHHEAHRSAHHHARLVRHEFRRPVALRSAPSDPSPERSRGQLRAGRTSDVSEGRRGCAGGWFVRWSGLLPWGSSIERVSGSRCGRRRDPLGSNHEGVTLVFVQDFQADCLFGRECEQCRRAAHECAASPNARSGYH